ncbi:MAG: PAS domain S-box-containing protein [Planctomycetota bacterium]
MNVNDVITRQAWEASPLAILTLDREDVIRFANPAGTRIFARDEDSIVGQRIEDLTHSLDRLALTRMLEEARDGGVPPRQEMRFRRPGDSNVTTGFSVALGHGSDSYTVCVIRDLSTEKALRPRLLHTERMASMGLVASVIAHELNNALAGAIGCLELIQPKISSSDSELFETALQELHRSTEIVGDIKSYARSEEGMSERVSIPGLILSFKRLERYHTAVDGPSGLTFEAPADLPDLEGNKNQLLQALLNLVRNAEDAVRGLPTRRQQILVKFARHNDIVIVSVIDHGPGVPEELRGRLFEPFYSTKAAGVGTGLGLTVVQSVAAGHGGRIEICETPGGGSTFELLLPISANHARPAPEKPATPVSKGRSALRGVRILAADDEHAIRKILSRIGSSVNAVTVVVGSADAAIEELKRQEFDLVLLDVRMPGGGGPAVFQFITEHARHLVTRTIFMTGEPSPQLNSVRGSGYFAIINKPFHIADLKDVLEKALKSKAK